VNHPRINILDLDYVQLKEWLVLIGERPYRADQLLKWVYQKSAQSFEEMTDLPQDLRQKLVESAIIFSLKPLDERVSRDGETRKLLFQLNDGKTIESTLMFHRKSEASRERRTVCVSSQVGCAVGCYFCATGQQGFERNLRPGEIVEQILFFMHYLRANAPLEEAELSRRWITNVVFMGMGEPLANYDNVRQAVAMLNSPKGMGLGARQITLSTSGLVPQIRQLAEEDLHLELAISLHAATDEVRNRLVPINKKYPLGELIPACKEYFEKTGRRPTFEYALFDGINDSAKDAEGLIRLLMDFNCAVNLIVGNPTSCQEFRPSAPKRALAFQERLIAGGTRCMIRVSKGADIEAGCGQLRSRWLTDKTA
jgi:23S rRNA (adenine2503-C2)-methyltransferase